MAKLHGLAATAFIAVSGIAGGDSAHAPGCMLGHYETVTAGPYRADTQNEFVQFSAVRGAQVYVPAERGMTAEFLVREIRAAWAAGGGECRPDVRALDVSVISAGNGFWVLLTSEDLRDAHALARWATNIEAQKRGKLERL